MTHHIKRDNDKNKNMKCLTCRCLPLKILEGLKLPFPYMKVTRKAGKQKKRNQK